MPRSTHVYELNLEDESEKEKKKKKIVREEYNKEIQVRVQSTYTTKYKEKKIASK